jgi:nicotinamidase-related amidase
LGEKRGPPEKHEIFGVKKKRGINMKRALLVIDVQNEYFTGALPVSWPEGSFNNILKAVDAANAQGIPVIYIQHTSAAAGAKTFVRGANGWELHEKLKARKRDHIVEKNLPGSFTGTDLERILKSLNCDTVVISGYMTQMCCDTTARQAMHLGYGVEFLSDATGTLAFSNNAGSVTAEELHRAILVTQAARFSAVLSESEWEQRLVAE